MSNTTISAKSFVKLQKSSGPIDVRDLSANLSKAMQDAGVTAADLKKVAGKDGQIKGSTELKKLYKLLDRFDSSPGDKNLQLDGAAGTRHEALKAEGAGNRAGDAFAKQLSKNHGVVDVNN